MSDQYPKKPRSFGTLSLVPPANTDLAETTPTHPENSLSSMPRAVPSPEEHDKRKKLHKAALDAYVAELLAPPSPRRNAHPEPTDEAQNEAPSET